MLNLMEFKGNKVEILNFNDMILFNPYHVGACLELTDSAVRKAISNMNEKQAIKLTQSIVKDFHNLDIPTSGKLFLTESGVYKLVFKSNKPKAEEFTDWVTDEVLPSIRKYGSYTNDGFNGSDISELTKQISILNANIEKQLKADEYIPDSMNSIEKTAWKIKQFKKIEKLAESQDKDIENIQRTVLGVIYSNMFYNDKIDFDFEQVKFNKRYCSTGIHPKINIIADREELRNPFEQYLNDIVSAVDIVTDIERYDITLYEDVVELLSIVQKSKEELDIEYVEDDGKFDEWFEKIDTVIDKYLTKKGVNRQGMFFITVYDMAKELEKKYNLNMINYLSHTISTRNYANKYIILMIENYSSKN